MQDQLAQKIWQETELSVLARSRQAYDDTLALMQANQPEMLFAQLARVHRQPAHNWAQAALQIWQVLHSDFARDRTEFEQLAANLRQPAQRDELRLWLWRRVVRSGRQELIASRFFAEEHLFHRTLQEDRLLLWYGGERVAQWPIQLLLGLFLGGEHTKRLRLQLYWPTAKLPADFVATHAENRVLRRLWEARILVRFGRWAHLHPSIILMLPEISFTPPVCEWRGRELVAHMQDGRIWPITPFNLAALFFDEAQALFKRDRRGLWRNLTAYAEDYLARPEDVASHFVLRCFDAWGLHALRQAKEDFLKEFAESIRYLEQLRLTI